ncbi:uncharacterized protein LOC125744567 [Brienomyrus brachyistius]|uniref:uncharacterized protein LOC125744567 n=1 Tax=Brienomyrus brachyistius TaxID=42636 RepID=UPI0020B40C4C|nr:uncharacterized protein LOC125744567 [Brienomyrus brachyistius]
MCTWWPAVLIAATIGCLVDGDQEVRVPQGANITLLCSYSPLQRQRVKGWYRQSSDGLVPLGRTNGWVALSHRGRLKVSDVRQNGKVQVSMVEVGAMDTGEYCCASTMLFAVDIIQRITLHVSQGEKLDHMGGPGETQTLNSLIQVLEHSRTGQEDPATLSGMWSWARWLLFWLMSSGAVLSCIMISVKKRGLCDYRRSAAGQSDAEE